MSAIYGGAAARDSVPVSTGGRYRPRLGNGGSTMDEGTKRLALLGGVALATIGAIVGGSLWIGRAQSLNGLGRGRRRRR